MLAIKLAYVCLIRCFFILVSNILHLFHAAQDIDNVGKPRPDPDTQVSINF